MRLIAAVLVCVALAACGPGVAAPRTLTAQKAWARSSVPGAQDGVAYLTVTSPTTDLMVGVTVPASVAAKVEMHESMGEAGEPAMANMPEMDGANGTMTMMPLPGVDLPAGKTVALRPGAKHLVLKRLAAPLVAGTTFILTIKTGAGQTVDTSVTVRDNPP